MKKTVSLLLAVSMAASCAAGIAEGTYIPGQPTEKLTEGALASGRHVSVSLSGIFEPADDMVDDEEGQAALNAVSELLECSALRLGYASTSEGPRFEFGGYVYDDDGSLVSTDNSVTFTYDGIVLTTDLLEDRRITVGWETVMNAADLDADTQAQLLALRDADWSALSEQADAVMSQFGSLALTVAEPYIRVISEWIAALPAETVDEATNALVPETPGMTRIRISESHLLILADRLAEVLSQDSTLLPVLDYMLQYAGVTETDAATLISQVRTALVSAEVDDMSLVLTYTPSLSKPFVFNADLMLGGNAEPAADLLLMVTDGENGADQVTVRATAGQADAGCAFTADGTVSLSPSDPLVYDLAFTVGASLNGESVFSSAVSCNSSAFTGESGMPGYRANSTVSTNLPCIVTVDDQTYDTSITANSETSTEWVSTEDGGESCTIHETMEAMESGDVATDMISDAYYAIEPQEGGLFDAYFSQIYSVPDLGIESIGYSVNVFGDVYESSQADLTTVALEDLTGDQMDALISELGTAARTKRDQLIAVLPTELQDAATSILCGITTNTDDGNLPEAVEETYTEPAEPAADTGDYVSGYSAGYNDGFSAGFQTALSLYGIGDDGLSDDTIDTAENPEETFGGTAVEMPEEDPYEDGAVD